jgi:hypothetical protein
MKKLSHVNSFKKQISVCPSNSILCFPPVILYTGHFQVQVTWVMLARDCKISVTSKSWPKTLSCLGPRLQSSHNKSSGGSDQTVADNGHPRTKSFFYGRYFSLCSRCSSLRVWIHCVDLGPSWTTDIKAEPKNYSKEDNLTLIISRLGSLYSFTGCSGQILEYLDNSGPIEQRRRLLEPICYRTVIKHTKEGICYRTVIKHTFEAYKSFFSLFLQHSPKEIISR